MGNVKVDVAKPNLANVVVKVNESDRHCGSHNIAAECCVLSDWSPVTPAAAAADADNSEGIIIGEVVSVGVAGCEDVSRGDSMPLDSCGSGLEYEAWRGLIVLVVEAALR